jgi:hypothetical protein
MKNIPYSPAMTISTAEKFAGDQTLMAETFGLALRQGGIPDGL